VTDASLLLDRLVGDRTDLGLSPLDPTAAEQAMLAEVCSGFGMEPKEAAKVVLEVAEAGLAAFVRGQLMARGIPPGRATLIAFGGAGPVHAAPVAQRLGLKRVVVPYLAAGFSALGCLLCPPAQVALVAVNERLLALSPARLRELCAAALPVNAPGHLRLALIIRRGENPHEDLLLVRDADEPEEARLRRYQTFAQHAYGVRPAAETIRAVRLLVVLERGNSAIALAPSLEATFHRRQEFLAATCGTEPSSTLGGTPLVPVESLVVGRQAAGPALVVLPGASAFVPPGVPYHVDRWGNLVLETAP
jgi:N-methylhydantoinase A